MPESRRSARQARKYTDLTGLRSVALRFRPFPERSESLVDSSTSQCSISEVVDIETVLQNHREVIRTAPHLPLRVAVHCKGWFRCEHQMPSKALLELGTRSVLKK